MRALQWVVAVMVATCSPGSAGAQIQYATGQNVAPVYEGWLRNADGTIDMVFGYLNRNWEEILFVPVGAGNRIEPGGPDRGQPTVFFPRKVASPPGERREQFVFRVRLPKDWTPKQELIWTVTAHGRTDRAVGTLDPLAELDYGVIAMNRGAGYSESNMPPAVTLGVDATTVVQGSTVRLSALVSDDGAASGRRVTSFATPGLSAGLQVRWILYRGPAPVPFNPPRSQVQGQRGGTATATAHFTKPGEYVMRALADDGALFGTADVTVRVMPE